MTKKAIRACLFSAILVSPVVGEAHVYTYEECREASDFIRNAALSRDNGMTREQFLERLRGDLVAIRAFPPQLRWFVQDERDEAFLVSHVEQVFDSPRPSETHRTEFHARCSLEALAEARR